MKKSIILLIVLSILFFAVSCESDTLPDPSNNAEGLPVTEINTFADQFDMFWKSMNSRYVFWKAENQADLASRWDDIYKTYMPKFVSVDESYSEETSNSDFAKIKSYYKEICSDFADGHMSVHIWNVYSTDSDFKFSPSLENNEKRENFHYQYFSSGTDLLSEGAMLLSKATTETNYFTDTDINFGDYTFTNDFFCGYSTGTNDYAIYQRIKVSKDSNQIGYILYLLFSGYDITSNIIYDTYKGYVYKTAFAEAKEYLTTDTDKGKCLGLILDNRSNSGGNNMDLKYVIGLYTDSSHVIGKTQYKQGFGKYDLTNAVNYVIYPNTESEYYVGSLDVPYVVLCDLHSVSNGEIVSAGISTLPTGYSIGERTWGGTGPLYTSVYGDDNYTYGGSFGNKNGPLYVYTSSFWNKLKVKDSSSGETVFKSLEGIGFTPDYDIPAGNQTENEDASAWQTRVNTMLDSQMKAALSYIVTGTANLQQN